MYSKIYDFCEVRNFGDVFENTEDPTPRVKFIMELLDEANIDYVLDTFVKKDKYAMFIDNAVTCHNIIMKGTSNRMVVAHHDVNNCHIDNANDNSCSVINAIMTKKLMPELNVVLTDGEEFGGLGANRVSQQIEEGYFGDIEWVLNYELTGKGGKHFFIGDYPGNLTDHIQSLFACPIVRTPFNDSVTFIKNGIDSVVINPLPPLPKGEVSPVEWNEDTYLDYSMLYNCHSAKDSIMTICVDDMKEFVEEIALKILKN